MNYRRGYHNDIQNKGCDWEIEALFIKNWHELKQVLRNHIWVKPGKAKLIHCYIDHTGEYWCSVHPTDKGLYEAGYFDHGCHAEIKKFKTKENAIKWLEKIRERVL